MDPSIRTRPEYSKHRAVEIGEDFPGSKKPPERRAPGPRSRRTDRRRDPLLRRSGGGCLGLLGLLRLLLGLLLGLFRLLVGLLLRRLGIGGRLVLGAGAERDEGENGQGSGDRADHGRLLGFKAGEARGPGAVPGASAMPPVHQPTSRRKDWLPVA